MTIGVDQLAALLQECPNFAPIHPKTCAAAAKWLLPRLEAVPPNPDGACVETSGNGVDDKPLSKIAAMAVDLGDPSLSRTFRQRGVPRPHEPRPPTDDQGEARVTLPAWALRRLLGHGKTARFGSPSREAWDAANDEARKALRAGSPRETP